jgi:hypothetical protein
MTCRRMTGRRSPELTLLRAVVAAGAHCRTDPETWTRTRDGGKCMKGHSTKPGPLMEAEQ